MKMKKSAVNPAIACGPDSKKKTWIVGGRAAGTASAGCARRSAIARAAKGARSVAPRAQSNHEISLSWQ